jgi:hypothetical protein
LPAAFERLDRELDGREFLAGDFSIVDCEIPLSWLDSRTSARPFLRNSGTFAAGSIASEVPSGRGGFAVHGYTTAGESRLDVERKAPTDCHAGPASTEA